MAHYRIKTQPGSNIVTQSEFSRVIGVTPQTVGEFKRDDRLVLEYSAGRDRVLVNESIDKLNKTMQLNGVFRNRQIELDKIEEVKQFESFEELKENVFETQLDLETTDADELFKNAKALKEKSAALQAAAEHDKFIGELVEKSVVEKIIFERGRQFRDGMMSLSRRLAPELAGLDGMKEIESVLDREFRLLLENFSKLPVIE